mgnify:CR=1 FL=1
MPQMTGHGGRTETGEPKNPHRSPRGPANGLARPSDSADYRPLICYLNAAVPMADPDSRPPSHHLLRTLAAVPVSSEILDLGCGHGRHTEALLRLGFPVHACDPRPSAVETTRTAIDDLLEQGDVETVVQVAPLDAMDYPDETFDWVVAVEAETYVSDEESLRALFEEGRRLLKPGGWLYVTLPAPENDETEGTETREEADAPARFSEEALEAQRKAADLAEASAPTAVQESTTSRIRAIYRRVEPHTPV